MKTFSFQAEFTVTVN